MQRVKNVPLQSFHINFGNNRKVGNESVVAMAESLMHDVSWI